MEIVWSSEARNDVAGIIAYVAEFDPGAARRLRIRFDAAIIPLAEHPYLYREGRVSGTRELVVSASYVIVYEVADHIRIVSVHHTRQHYP